MTAHYLLFTPGETWVISRPKINRTWYNAQLKERITLGRDKELFQSLRETLNPEFGSWQLYNGIMLCRLILNNSAYQTIS